MKKYTIKKLQFIKSEQEQGFCKTPFGEYQIMQTVVGYMLIYHFEKDTYIRQVTLIQSPELFEVTDKAQEHFENLLMPYLQEVQDKSHLDIHTHANEWIKNDAEISLAKERLGRETSLEWTTEYVIQAIQMFVKNLVSEGDTQKTVVDFRKYFYNFTKYRINNATKNSKTRIGNNDTRNSEQRLQDAFQMFE